MSEPVTMLATRAICGTCAEDAHVTLLVMPGCERSAVRKTERARDHFPLTGHIEMKQLETGTEKRVRETNDTNVPPVHEEQYAQGE